MNLYFTTNGLELSSDILSSIIPRFYYYFTTNDVRDMQRFAKIRNLCSF